MIEPNAFVARVRALTSLYEEDLNALAQLIGDHRPMAPEQMLVMEGSEPRFLHLLVEGWAARQKMLRDGRRHFSAVLVPGDLCDVDGLHVQSYDYGVVALTRGIVARIDRAALLALCDDRPQIAHAFTWLGFVDNSLLNEASVSLARRSARQRLGHLLCELSQRLDVVGKVRDGSFELPLTQDRLGDALGLTAVHINRTMKQLREAGRIDVNGRVVTITDWQALRREAGFSPQYLHLEGMRQEMPLAAR